MLHKFNVLPLFKTAALIFLFSTQFVQAETISVPMKIGFPQLQQLLISQLFKDPSASTEILNDPHGCSEITLSDPKLSEFKQHLQVDARLKARLAVKMLDICMPLLNWDGYAQIISKPVIKTDNPHLIYLQVVDSHLINLDQVKLTTGPLWDQTRKQIQPLFDKFRLDLTPSINDIKSFLPLLLPQHSHDQVSTMLDSMQLHDIQIEKSGINGKLQFNVVTVVPVKQQERVLNEQEQQQWQQKWQSMDALLTYTIKYYAAATELEELRQTLLEILLDARYQLQVALQQDQASDPVRHWFIKSWTQLIPILQKISAENPQQAPLALLTLVTATDALQTLDKLGPTFGLDISIDGLRRLARMLNSNPTIDPLYYDQAIDPELLRIFQFNPDPDSSSDERSHYQFNFWPVNSAMAAGKRPLDNWVPAPDELDDYLLQVRTLLINSARRSITKSSLTPQQRDIFQKLVLTTAWQESCWRQYVIKNKKIVALHSSTGDTGIMQVNENVWRGFVNTHKLRWNIAYNVETGSNILLKYMTSYAIKKSEHKQSGGIDNLARSTYSTYNGGPGQVARYRNRQAGVWSKKVDKAFHRKYLQVKRGEELAVAECLGGTKTYKASSQPQQKQQKLTATSLPKKHPSPTKIAQPLSGTKKIIHNEAWIKQQAKNYFTLQLAAFSSEQAAKDFIGQQSNQENFAIYQSSKNNSKQLYTVIYGYYSTRKSAEKGDKQFKSLKAWIRPFKDIQALIKSQHKQQKITATAPKTKPPTTAKIAQSFSGTKKIIHNQAWIKQQAKNDFTLQLAAFSSEQAAKAFIGQQSSQGNYAIYQHRKTNSKRFYTVIYGYYSTRQRAEKGGRQFKSLKAWIRPFNDIQLLIK